MGLLQAEADAREKQLAAEAARAAAAEAARADLTAAVAARDAAVASLQQAHAEQVGCPANRPWCLIDRCDHTGRHPSSSAGPDRNQCRANRFCVRSM